MSEATIFISYRREDTSGYAGRLYDRLSARFGAKRIFMDIDTIKPGVDFVTVIDDAVASCEVLLALIGKEWLTITDPSGARRLDNANDFNRLEIESGLNRTTTVIPVLVQGSAMPRPEDLPETMAPLARRNAIELSDVRWDYDVERLITAIEEITGEPAPAPAPALPSRKKLPWLIAGAIAAAAVVVAAAFLIAGGAPACGGEGPDVASLANSQIAFLSDRDHNVEIYGMTAEGNRVTRFTHNAVDDLRPDWSPDGRQLVFGSGSGRHDLCVMSVDRSSARLLKSTGGDEEAPDWSPDGTHIVFSSGSSTQSNIFTVAADGSGRTQLTRGDANDRSPDWSTTDLIVFSSNRSGSFDIFVMAADGSDIHRLTKGSFTDGAPAWSSDGARIAFPRKANGQSHIFVMNADGSGLHAVTHGPVSDTGPTWSPQDGSLAFSRNSNGSLNIFRLDFGTGRVRELASGPGHNFDPAWGPLP